MTSNNQPSLEQAYTELRKSLLAYLRKLTGNADAAEDVLHDVLLKALVQRSNQIKPPENLAAWLYTVARNSAMDYHRQTRQTLEVSEDLPDLSADMSSEYLELADCLRPMVERLPEKYRKTMIQAELNGALLSDLAQIEGVSLSAIKSRASRGRKMLQDEMVSCCSVILSAKGEVLDYDLLAAKQCAPRARSST
jgi:RNA polymerase sigma-70 factor (ECF subfamily)